MDKLIKLVKKQYSQFAVLLKIGKEQSKIKVGYGVRQDNNLAPTLFIIVMHIIFEDIIAEIRANNIDLSIIYVSNNKKGPIRKHKTKTKYAELTEILMLLYINSGEMIFEGREDIRRGVFIIYKTYKKIELTIHIDQNNLKSKTEAVFFPSRKTFQLWNELDSKLQQCRRNKWDFNPKDSFIEFTTQFIYLGSVITLDYNLKSKLWEDMINKVVDK